MKTGKKPILLFFVFLTVATMVLAQDLDILTSDWNSNFDAVHITQQGPVVWGSYDYSGGRFIGALADGKLYGYWWENDDTSGCGPDNAWCGPFILTFNAQGTAFTGIYGKHSRGESDFTKMDPTRHWNGTLKNGALQLFYGSGSFGKTLGRQTSLWDSNFKRVTLIKEGPLVWGTYDYNGGRFTGALYNGKLYGFWWESDDTAACGPNNAWCGPMVLTFDPSGKSFTGLYGKSSRNEVHFSSLDPSRHWDGTFVSGLFGPL